MTRTVRIYFALVILALSTRQLPAQNDPSKDKRAAPAASHRAGDPYPLNSCPVSGKKLGSMGDPAAKLYEGREVRFCCPACPKAFEKDLSASFAKLDEKLIKDQRPLYLLKTSVVSGKELPEKPFDLVYGDRLIRLAAESEKAELLKDPSKALAKLDQAVIAIQGKHYPLATCPVSGDKYGGEMGEPKDVVVAGRLLRLCCNDCKKDLEKDPAKYISKVDAALKGKEKPAQAQGVDDKPHDTK